MTEKKVEVFQDLHLRVRSAAARIREEILAHVRSPWRHDADREHSVQSHALEDEDVIALVREPLHGIDEAALVLWGEESGYRVANIVPRNVGELGIANYNAILQDFVQRIAEPAARAGGFAVDLSPCQQTLEDWMNPAVAETLRRFSHLANKSTGTAHPLDQDRWFAFLIAAHRAPERPDPERLARWLEEVEGWPGDTARELAGDYEVARGLLEKYDREGA